MRIDLLNSGSKGNSCVIRSHDSQLILDIGAPTLKYWRSALKQADVQLEDTDGVLITHTHIDHIKWIKYVSQFPIYSNCALDVPDHHHVDHLVSTQIGGFQVTPIRLSHDAPCTGYVIEADDEKLVYVTDTGFIPNAEKELLVDANYYVFESNHDVGMLMDTNRPYSLKQRILGDSGHLNNEVSANELSQYINTNTKRLCGALSEEANHPQLAHGYLVGYVYK